MSSAARPTSSFSPSERAREAEPHAEDYPGHSRSAASAGGWSSFPSPLATSSLTSHSQSALPRRRRADRIRRQTAAAAPVCGGSAPASRLLRSSPALVLPAPVVGELGDPAAHCTATMRLLDLICYMMSVMLQLCSVVSEFQLENVVSN